MTTQKRRALLSFIDPDIDALRNMPKARRKAEIWRRVAESEDALRGAGKALVDSGITIFCQLDLGFFKTHDGVEPPDLDSVRWGEHHDVGGLRKPLTGHQTALLARFRADAIGHTARIASLLALFDDIGSPTLQVTPEARILIWCVPFSGMPRAHCDGTFYSGTGTLAGDVAALNDLRAASRRLESPAANRYLVHFRTGKRPFDGEDTTLPVMAADAEEAVRLALTFEQLFDRLEGRWREGKAWEGRRLVSVKQILDSDVIAKRLQAAGVIPQTREERAKENEDD